MPPRTKSAADLQKEIARLQAELEKAQGGQTVPRRGGGRRSSANGKLPFPEFNDIKTAERTAARHILRERTPKELRDALAYEKANSNRKVVLDLIQEAIDRKASGERDGRRSRQAASTGDLPFRDFNKLASGKQTESRAILAKLDADTLERTLAYEKAHQNRKVLVSIMETQLRKKQRDQQPEQAVTSTRARGRAQAQPAADAQPFRGYERIQSGKQTEARALLARQDADTLEAALAYEKAHQNRKMIVSIIETQLRKKQRREQKLAGARPAAAAADKLPFRTFNQLRAADRKAAKQILSRRSVDELRATIAYEKAHRNRAIILRLAEEALADKQQAQKAAQAGAPRRAGRPTRLEQPDEWVGTPPIPAYITWSLTAPEEHRNSRVQIAALEDANLLKQLIEFEQAQPKPRSTILNLLIRRYRAVTGAGTTKGPRSALLEPGAKLPFPEYGQVQSSKQTQSRQLLNQQDLATLRKTLEFERSHGGRVQVLDMIETAIKRKEAEQDPLPFPEYGRLASSRHRESKAILRSKTMEELDAALRYENTHGKRVQVIRLIEDAKERLASGAPLDLPPLPEPAPIEGQPFPGYERLQSSKQTESRAILAQQDIPALERALEFERSHANRKQIIGLIETQLRKKQRGGQQPRPAAAGDQPMPFPGYENVASGKQTESRAILAQQDIPTLERALEYEQANKNRGIVIKMIQTQLNKKRRAQQPAAATASRQPQVTPAQDLPFRGYERIQSGKQTEARALLARQDAPTLEAALAYERANQNRKVIVSIIETQLRKKQRGQQPAAAPSPGQMVEQTQQTPNGNLPFPGYDQVASSKRTESRAILVGQDVDTLRRALAYEEQHRNRGQVKDLIETIIRQKESGRVRASRRTGGEPLPDYDNLPTKVIVEAIAQGTLDSKLDQILAYERERGGRAEIIRACQDRLSIPREEGQIVSPTGRVWKGREPWRGYGTLDHNDKPVLVEAFKQRSSGELRRVEQAEARQDFPSQTAIDTAKEILAERERQPVNA